MLGITNKNFYTSIGASSVSAKESAQGTLTARTLPKGRRRDTLFLFSALLAILALTAAPLHADDFSEGFGGGFSSEEPSSESSEDSAESPQLEWGGFVSTTMRSYIDTDDPGDSAVDTYPEIGLDLNYSADNSEAVANLRFHRNWLYDADLERQALGHQNVVWYLQQMIDEAYLRLFYDNFDLQAGFLKEVWGTGDQSHVVDLLNPTDYYDFVNIDYIDRKLAEFMFKLNIPFSANGLIELAYVPTFTPDSSPLYGTWAPQSVSQITSIIENDDDSITLNQPDTNTISNGQAALRVSGTAGGIDLAGTYYFGYLRQPGLDITYTGTPPNLEPAKAELSYDRVHVFGLDAAGVLAGFNLRGEAAYYLTEDYEGDDASRLNNHSVQYVAGFDRNLPLSELNLNIQTIGAYFINEDDDPARTIVSAALSDSWNNDKIKPEVSASYGVEEEDWMIRPEVTFDLVDDVELTAGGAIFLGSSDGRFGQFEDNNYAEVELTYNF